jgi:hypothetical protein
MRVRTKIAWTAVAVAAMALPLAAVASHGKAGLWEVTTHMNMPNMRANIPPEALARMKAMGMNMPDNQTFTSQRCMTAADVAEDKPPPMRNNEDCAMSNMSHDAHTFTADMTCNTQRMQGRGHLSVNFDSAEHYAGSYTFNGTSEGHPQNMTYNFEGRWISADCGSVK